jgi:hypothetical protein
MQESISLYLPSLRGKKQSPCMFRHCEERSNLLVGFTIEKNKDSKFQEDCHENPLDDLSKQEAFLSGVFSQ